MRMKNLNINWRQNATNNNSNSSTNNARSKQARKQSDNLVADGIKLLSKIDYEHLPEDESQIIALHQQAEHKYQQALGQYHDHPEALYNLGVLMMEKLNLKSSFHFKVELIKSAMLYASRVIELDTSGRGETAGLAHRSMALILVQHCHICCQLLQQSSWQEIFKKANYHIHEMRRILLTNKSVDAYIFEYCSLFKESFSTFLSCEHSPNPSSMSSSEFGMTMEVFSSSYNILSQNLLTEQVSGLDMDCIILQGEMISDIADYVIRAGKFVGNEVIAVHTHTKAEALLLINRIRDLSDGDTETNELIIDLIVAWFRLSFTFNSIENLEAFNACGQMYLSMVFSRLNLSTDPSNLLLLTELIALLADNVMQFWNIILGSSLLEECLCQLFTLFKSSILLNNQENVIVQAQQQYYELKNYALNSQNHVFDLSSALFQFSLSLKYIAKVIYEAISSLCSNLPQDENTREAVKISQYNLAALYWSQGLVDQCREVLHLYVQNHSKSDANELAKIHSEIVRDTEFKGIENMPWFELLFV